MLTPPHHSCPDGEIWAHVTLGLWAGGQASRTFPVAEASQRPCVHLLVPGSNTCLTGFRSPLEAALYRETYQLTNLRMVDLRDDRPLRLRQDAPGLLPASPAPSDPLDLPASGASEDPDTERPELA